MGRLKGTYNAEFPIGKTIRIADRSLLELFMKTWKYHNPLQPEQLDYAEKIATVKKILFYHGGDELYLLEEIPGIWHEVNLTAVE